MHRRAVCLVAGAPRPVRIESTSRTSSNVVRDIISRNPRKLFTETKVLFGKNARRDKEGPKSRFAKFRSRFSSTVRRLARASSLAGPRHRKDTRASFRCVAGETSLAAVVGRIPKSNKWSEPRGDGTDVVGLRARLVSPDDEGHPRGGGGGEGRSGEDSPLVGGDRGRKWLEAARLHARILEFLGECAPHDAAIARSVSCNVAVATGAS